MDVGEPKSRKERVRDLATRQHGRLARAQLERLGISNGMLRGWLATGYATRVLRKVYAIGHLAPSREADLWAAVLYAGPGAMLSHATAAHRYGLLKHPPALIEVSTPRGTPSVPGVLIVHRQRRIRRVLADGLPITTIERTMLDLAASADPRLVRHALAELDYRRRLDVGALQNACGRGLRGSTALRRALAVHQPRLAYTNQELEARFLLWCERFGLPIPQFNVWVHGVLVDAHWPEHRLVVELDGGANHTSVAQLRRDRRNELKLRGYGLTVVRYDWDLLHDSPVAMRTDLIAQLRSSRPEPVRGTTRPVQSTTRPVKGTTRPVQGHPPAAGQR